MQDYNWSYDEFLCFLMIYASNVDLDYSDVEKLEVSKNFSPETVTKITSAYESMNDYQCLNTIIEYRQIHFPNVQDKEELLKLIHKMFLADGVYDDFEKEIYHFLEKII